jgi:hypothetical protein
MTPVDPVITMSLIRADDLATRGPGSQASGID